MKITDVNHLYLPDGSLNPEIREKKILIYGCKDAGRNLYDLVQKYGGTVHAFVDRRFEDYKDAGFMGLDVLAPAELRSYNGYSLLMSFGFWPQIIGDIPSGLTVYANYPFWDENGCECMFCGSRQTVSMKSFFYPFLQERMFLGNPPGTDWIHCKNCEISYSSYRPVENEFARLYSGYRGDEYTGQRMKYEPEYDNGKMFGEEATEKRRKDVYGFCKDVITTVPGSILDYGGDRGQYIPKEWEESDRFVYEISGNEPVSGVGVINDLSTASDHKWDLIMNCHVLEHVSDPGEILKSIRKLMDENTLFYLELPCEFVADKAGVHEHINMFTKHTLQMIGEKYGFEVIKCGNPDCGGAIAAIYRKREQLPRELTLGLLGWYDFNTDGKILLVGDNADVYADYCGNKGLVSETISMETLTGKWSDEHKNEFSYIICITELEKSNEPVKVLSLFRELLSDGGHLLLGMNNRFGLKYFCGDRDPYSDRYFDGIEGYSASDSMTGISGKCYSKNEIKDLLNNSGFEKYRFFSVLPGLDTASFIFSDDYLPNEDLSNRVFPAYNDPMSVFMKEQSLYTSLMNEGLFHSMADAFLIECTDSGDLSNVNQVTASPDRGKENALFTLIRRDGLVEKRAMYPEGIAKFKAMKENEEDLKAHGIKVIESSLEKDRYIMPFEKSPLTQVYLKELLFKDKDRFLSEMDRFRDTVLKSSEIRKLDDGTEVFKKGYYDLVPLNSFYREGEFYFIDQEFCIEDLPVKVMSMRQIESFYFGDPAAEKELPRIILYKRYGIYEERQRWSKIECDFLDNVLNKDILSGYYKEIRTDDTLIKKRRREMDSRFFNNAKRFEGKKVYLFGSGKYAERFLDTYGNDIPVCGMLDNNRDKHGSEKCGLRVYAPDILKLMDKGSFAVIICVKDHEDIEKQLREMNVRNYCFFDPGLLIEPKTRSSIIVDGSSDISTGKPYHIGYCAGAFDMFHIGHLNLLRRAKERCDYLIAGVMSDERMYQLKNKYPVIPCNERMQVVAGCRYVDRVEELPADRAGIMDAWNMFHYDCMFSGDDHANDPGWLAERENLRKHGSDIVFVSYTKETSSSAIREKMKGKD